MNYNEIAEAYDNQADTLQKQMDLLVEKQPYSTTPLSEWMKLQFDSVRLILELREKAEDCRSNARREDRAVVEHAARLEYDEFDREVRKRWADSSARTAAAEERKAAAYEAFAKRWAPDVGPDNVLLHGPRGTEIVR